MTLDDYPVDVTVYSKSGCVQCTATTKKLDQLGVPYSYVDIEQDETLAETVKSWGFFQAPVVEVYDKQDRTLHRFSGYVPSELKKLAL